MWRQPTFMITWILLTIIAVTGCTTIGPIFEPSVRLREPWPMHTIDDSSHGADGARLADVNADGYPDLAVPWEEGGVIRVYLHPGTEDVKNRWPMVTVGQVASPEDAVFVDLDQDGAMDVVSSCEGSTRTIFVHWAPQDSARYLDATAWQTEALPASAKVCQWMFTTPADLDGQAGPDLAAGAKMENASVGWFESPRNPRQLTEWQWHPLRSCRWIMSLQSVDMDGDGNPDLLFSDRKGPRRGIYWLANPGRNKAGTESWREYKIGGEDWEVMFLTVVDLNRDGRQDVLAATRSQEILYFQQGLTTDNQWSTHTIDMPARTGTGKGIAAGDIDLDGQLDLVFTCENAANLRGVMWMSYHDDPATGEWSAGDISGLTGAKFDLAKLVDLDQDGDLDLITCEERENLGVIWYENPCRP